MFWTRALALLALTSGFGLAHPPGMEEETSQQAGQPLRHISQCHDALQEPQFIKRTIERRQVEFDRLRKERGLDTRSLPPHRRQADKLAELLHKDHQVHKPFNKDTRPDQLFADDGACMMAPLVSEGPLYVSGEQVRRNLTDYETGVPMSLDIQVVDAKTCKPVHNVAVDIWSCNTTGIYSGVWALPRNPVDYDRSVINTTALRGIQFTDDEGVANFDTFFPGHYEGRAVHIHAMVHVDAKRQPNGTITGGRVAHVTQLYFDQSLITNVEKLQPYTTNRQRLTTNSNDGLLKKTKLSDDPFFRYVLLGNRVEDGIFAYIRLGIDTSASFGINPAAYRDEAGGHQNATGPMGDGSRAPWIPPDPIPIAP